MSQCMTNKSCPISKWTRLLGHAVCPYDIWIRIAKMVGARIGSNLPRSKIRIRNQIYLKLKPGSWSDSLEYWDIYIAIHSYWLNTTGQGFFDIYHKPYKIMIENIKLEMVIVIFINGILLYVQEVVTLQKKYLIYLHQ